MKRKPYNVYLTGTKGDKVWGTQWVVETNINYDGKAVSYFRAIVRSRRIARELVTLLKENF